MSVMERLYDRSPILLQNLMCSIKGWQNNISRYGDVYWQERAFLEKFDHWTLAEKETYQNEMLKQFVAFAYENSPFYKRLYAGIDISRINSVDDLKLLPIVDKETLRKNIDDVVTRTGTKTVESHTGGTTGKSLVVRMTLEDNMKRMAMLDHFKARVGFENLKMKRATFNGKHVVPPNQKTKVFWRYNAACRQMIFSTFQITDENMGLYVKELNRFQPVALDGFFTCMCDLAKYIERKRISLTFTPVAIFPTSETLTDSGRELLERVFRCKVYDQYASSEGAPFVTECREQVKHVELVSGAFENLEGSDEILVTSFTTHGTPLIRYRIGDRMEFAGGDTCCRCGMDVPVVERIEGRRLDFLYTADGGKVNAGNVANLFKNLPNVIVQAQLVQTEIGAITAKLVVDWEKYRPEHDEMLFSEFYHKFPGSRLTIEHVDDIPREKSGKFRLIVNRLAESNNIS